MIRAKRIEFTSYILKKRAQNAGRVGAILRVETNRGWGYSDLHPWPERGDAYLKPQLAELSAFQAGRDSLSPLLTQSMHYAFMDAEARAEKKNLFTDLQIPRSHYLLSDESEISESSLFDIRARGFKTLKVKIGGEALAAAVSISHLAELTQLKLRLDANEAWTEEAFGFFAEKLTPKAIESIEFVEDPFHSGSQVWAQWQTKSKLKFARDFSIGESYPVRVLKPAIENPGAVIAEEARKDLSYVVTSYLGHPLGQAIAAVEAARLAQNHKVLECGLMSHLVYEPNEFTEVIAADGPQFPRLAGTGFGFDECLQNQRWQVLK